jgi:hypothetical protein
MIVAAGCLGSLACEQAASGRAAAGKPLARHRAARGPPARHRPSRLVGAAGPHGLAHDSRGGLASVRAARQPACGARSQASPISVERVGPEQRLPPGITFNLGAAGPHGLSLGLASVQPACKQAASGRAARRHLNRGLALALSLPQR